MSTVRHATPDDFDRVFDLTRQAFNVPTTARERARAEFVPANGRVLEDGGEIAASLRILPFAQRWGGRAISSAGIGGVAVPADQRGRGRATALMRETLGELRDAGTLLSTLYPATVPVYRSCGYGFGGVRSLWKTDLRVLPTRGPLHVEPFSDDDLDEAGSCYARVAARTSGLVERDRDWWLQRVLRSAWHEGEPYRYLVREDGRVTGYVIYRLERSHGEEWRSTIQCRDLIWETDAAGRTLLALLSMHRSTSSAATWIGPPTEPLADLLAEDQIELDFRFRWMLRLLDVPGAIEARGYSPHVEAAATIAVRDPLLAENAGPWRVEVTDGRAKVAPADRADATADVSTWASLWSGLHAPADAVRLGALGATEEALAALGAMFAGPTPWLADFF